MQTVSLVVIALLSVSVLITGAAASLARWKGGGLVKSPLEVTNLPVVTVIIPTFNEAPRIRDKLENVLRQDYPKDKLSVIVVDSSTDETPSIVDQFGQTHGSSLSLLHTSARRGLAADLNEGYRNAPGSIVIKSDCDALLVKSDSIRLAVAYLTRPEVGSVTGAYVPREIGEIGYRKTLHKLQVAESNLDSTPIAHGAFFAFKKSLYREIDPNSLADDTEIALSIRRQGFKTLLVPKIESVESHPTKALVAVKQRSRRARGILRLYATTSRGMILNVNYGLFGLVVLPLEIALMTVVPIALASSYLLLLYLLGLYLGESAAAVAAATSLACIYVALRSKSAISGLLLAQVSSLMGLILLLFPQSGIYQRTRD